MYSLNRAAAVRRPSAGLIVVIGLHAAFLYALIHGLSVKTLLQKPSQMDAVMIFDSKAPIPVPVPKSDPVIRNVFQPDPIDPPPTVITDETVPSIGDPPVGPETQPGSGTGEITPSLGARVDPRHPLTQPPYPAMEIRGGHEGALTLSLLVGTDGRVAQAKVIRSSGYPLLDEAAVNEAKRHWRLLPAVRGNAPVEDWMSLRVVFRLDQR